MCVCVTSYYSREKRRGKIDQFEEITTHTFGTWPVSVSTNFFIWCVCFSSSLFTVGEPQKNKELCAAARYTHTHTWGVHYRTNFGRGGWKDKKEKKRKSLHTLVWTYYHYYYDYYFYLCLLKNVRKCVSTCDLLFSNGSGGGGRWPFSFFFPQTATNIETCIHFAARTAPLPLLRWMNSFA